MSYWRSDAFFLVVWILVLLLLIWIVETVGPMFWGADGI
jgi:hypothetical protein